MSDRLFNRDLSWLQFNDRVLSEAASPEAPPLERLRFATIVSSNLDEFFMVRVAELARLARRGASRRFPDGLSASQVLGQVREHVLRQKAQQAAVFEEVLKDLRREGVDILTDFTENFRHDRRIQRALPAMTFCPRRSSDPLPPLLSERLHVFVRFPGEYAIITLVDREGRLLDLGGPGGIRRFALAERWLCDRAQALFSNREVIEAFPFKIIRDADLRYRPDDEESLEEQIAQAVRRRLQAKIVRLEVDSPSYSEGALFLAAALGLDSAGLYRFDLPLDLRTLARIYPAVRRPGLRYPPVQPKVLRQLRGGEDVFAALRRRDLLLHHPYDSFEIVLGFLEAAARDPDVTHIYHTLYRTSRESPVLASLQEAARRGKAVTVYVEIKARFDELNNLRWAEELRRAGVRVIRPLGTYKVHSKLALVLRREGEEQSYYLHLGTGNYHPVTARQYTDLSLLTRDQEIGREVAGYFAAMSRGERPGGFQELMVAPGNMHRQLLKLIEDETLIQKGGGRGHVIAKMNSLVDPDAIEALYRASQAGVKVELLVRGICCLRPGIQGLSENVRVVSVIDRFLEHSRVYYFRAGGNEKVYLSSADWMPRNFYTRYELAYPVKDPLLRKYIRGVILAGGLSDNVKAWTLRPDGTYARVERPKGAKPFRSQAVFQALARSRYRDTVLAQRR